MNALGHSVVSTNRPRGGENPLTTGVKQAVLCPTAPVARPGICRFPLKKKKKIKGPPKPSLLLTAQARKRA
jgi:hypothetical protein